MIDWSRLRELREEIGADGLSDVVGVFLDETDEVMAGLPRMAPAQLGAPLHFLKGSALNLGLRAFGALCEEGEQMATAGDAAPVDLARLRTVYEASKTAFLAALARGAAA
ncbi:Hpt domain-containing protein [Neotabrizicola sp. VNH66]|uniref:Hpt domain-containing protein n=1 Tax=Neotabrizicola sp. VNH66 TaxID=3400918 RepID=UPI003C030DCE